MTLPQFAQWRDISLYLSARRAHTRVAVVHRGTVGIIPGRLLSSRAGPSVLILEVVTCKSNEMNYFPGAERLRDDPDPVARDRDSAA